MDIKLLKQDARISLAQAGRPALLITGVYLILVVLCGFIFGKTGTSATGVGTSVALTDTIVMTILRYGYVRYTLALSREEEGELSDLIAGFTGENVWNKVLAAVLVTLCTCIGYALFLIPGIVLGLSYSMTFYIMEDNPDMSAVQAMAESRRLMQGHKWTLFGLYLSFIGWYLAVGFTAGLAAIWVTPYTGISEALFYQEISGQLAP